MSSSEPALLCSAKPAEKFDVVTFRRPYLAWGEWRYPYGFSAHGESEVWAQDGMEDVLSGGNYWSEWTGGAFSIRVPDGLEGAVIEITVSDESVFASGRLVYYGNSDFSAHSFQMEDATLGAGGDPLKGFVEVSKIGSAIPRVRCRRDKGAWFEPSLGGILNSWVRDYWVSDGWREVYIRAAPYPSLRSAYPTAESYSGVADTPPGEPFTLDGWSVTEVRVFTALLGDGAAFWTNFRECREVIP